MLRGLAKGILWGAALALTAAPAAAQVSEIACQGEAGAAPFAGGFVALERDTSTQDITMTLSGLPCGTFIGYGTLVAIDVVCATGKDAGERYDRLQIDRVTSRFVLSSLVGGEAQPARQGTCAITVP